MAALAKLTPNGAMTKVESMWHMLDLVHAMALQFPKSEIGEFCTAMMWWKRGVSDLDKVAIDNLMALEVRMPWEAPKTDRQWPVKGFIPPALFTVMQKFYPGFIRDEDFLDEFFGEHPLGQIFASPCWKPKPVSERISRGVSPYARRVHRQLADGTYEPYMAQLRRPLIEGGERTAGA